MSRRLAADEKALWALVAATVKPLPGRKLPPVAVEVAAVKAVAAAPIPPSRKSAGPTKPPRSLPTKAPPAPLPNESLDGSWDKKLASGKVQPDLVIDLHGHTREAARRLLHSRVLNAEAHGHRVILVITGKGLMPGPSPADLMEGRPTRGAIKADFPRWLGEEGLSSRIAAVRRAHPRHGGEGAAYLILKRHRAYSSSAGA